MKKNITNLMFAMTAFMANIFSVYAQSTVVITTEPASQTVCENANATFTVSATGVGTLSYKWQTDNGTGTFADISGEVSSSLALTGVSSSSNGFQYRVIIIDDNLSPATSSAATLTISPSTVIVTQPSGANLCVGNPLYLHVGAAGSGFLTYEWNLNGSPIPGATSSDYTAASVSGTDEGTYTANVTGICGSATSFPATVTVNGVSISGNPTDQTVSENANATFTVSATGLGTLSYQWQTDSATGTFADISGETSFTLVLDSVSLIQSGYQYRVVMKDDNVCPATSSAATLTESSTTSISNQLANLSVNVFPNPFSQSTVFNINGNSASTYKLSITNTLGEPVATYEIKNQNTFTLNRTGLSSGLYFYVISDEDGKSSTGKLVVE